MSIVVFLSKQEVYEAVAALAKSKIPLPTDFDAVVKLRSSGAMVELKEPVNVSSDGGVAGTDATDA